MTYPIEIIRAAEVLLDYADKTGAWLNYTEYPEFKLPDDLRLAVAAEKARFRPADLVNLWNDNKAPELPKAMRLTAKRAKHCNARIKEYPDKKKWLDFLLALNTDDWACCRKPNLKYPGWTVDFDWFIRPDSMLAFAEGRFRVNPRNDIETEKHSYRDEYDEELARRDRHWKNRERQ